MDDAGPTKGDTGPHDATVDAPPSDAILSEDSGSIGDLGAATDEGVAVDGGAPIDDGVAVDDGPPPVDACTPSCATCGGDDGCGGTCTSGACSGGASCVSGACITPTSSFLSPGSYYDATNAFATMPNWTIASADPATIYYSLDGSPPGPGGLSGTNVVNLSSASIATGTLLTWYADDGVAEPTVHALTLNANASLESDYGWIVDGVDLGGGSPVIVTSPGAAITGSAAYRAWVSPACPLCAMQLVYGLESDAAGCFYDDSPSTYAGASGTSSIALTAPTTPGTYTLNVTFTLQYACTDALATAPLEVRPTNAIGVVIVR